MTVSEVLRPSAVPAVPAPATPAPRTVVPAPASPVPAAGHRALPTPAGSPEVDLASRVGGAVAALRGALENGTVHHHRRSGIPESRTAVGVEVVRAWAAGLGVDEQHRVCRVCAPVSAG